jgi:hypothetical protein
MELEKTYFTRMDAENAHTSFRSGRRELDFAVNSTGSK